ncbi:hypothetical protein ENUP19_0181G0020 [Entamoeba nuttalli]|uniref:RNA-dependent RNA polymerase n=2 Tax=Entamoeba nuttalli TaxID=412467 RepID=K2HQI2_ENTNP|nr:RNA-directed RNA polymerase, putative [Entamoeba nuttalli P19]EKE38145.1 RNA-directed RNA polymerase, putative [Entamoeba nuttalli P19]|eukprot:XP_008859519.1 RNA-directed RNA polymerase, putative [Entamoeba nuttalli P19]
MDKFDYYHKKKQKNNNIKQAEKIPQCFDFIGDIGLGSFVDPVTFAIEKQFTECYIRIDHNIFDIHTMEYVYRFLISSLHRIIISPNDKNSFILIIKDPLHIHIPSSSFQETQILDFTPTKLINRCHSIYFSLPEYTDKVIQILQNSKQGKAHFEHLTINVPYVIDSTIDLQPKIIIEYPSQQETAVLFQLEGLYLQGIIIPSQITKDVIQSLCKFTKDILLFFKKQATMKAQSMDYLRLFSLEQVIEKCQNDYNGTTKKWKDEELVLKMEVNSSLIRLGYGYNESNAILEDFSPEFRVKMLRMKFLNNEKRMQVMERLETDLMCFYMIKGYKSFFQKRYFQFLLSNPSQSRSGACWFIDNQDGKTTMAAYQSLGVDLKSPKIKNAGILLMRTGLFGSDSIATVGIYPQQIKVIDDITNENGYTFSDGVGRIGYPLAKKVLNEYKRNSNLFIKSDEPYAFQIRFAGVKGVLTVDRLDMTENIYFRPSQIKIEALPKTIQKLRVIQIPQFRSGRMNEQLALGLEYLQIPPSNFISSAKQYLKKYFSVTPNREIISLFQRFTNNPVIEVALKIIMASNGNQKIYEEPFIRATSLVLRMSLLSEKTDFIKFDIDNSAFLMGVMDESGLLEEGEVFIQVTTPTVTIPSSRLLVVKFPATHPGDFVLLNNVVDKINSEKKKGFERLTYLRDVIVFSSKGNRPDPNKLSGGDLDGDEYLIIWNPLFLPKPEIHSHAPATYDSEKVHLEKFLEFTDMKRAFLSQLYSKFVLSRISVSHKESCMNIGMCAEVTKSLSQLISITVDAPKTGAEVDGGEINELVEQVSKTNNSNKSILLVLKSFFNEQIPIIMDTFYTELIELVNTIHYNSEFISDSILPDVIPFARKTRNEFNNEINWFLKKSIPQRILRGSEPLQLIIGGVFKKGNVDRLEWEKEEKEINQTLLVIYSNYRKKVEQEAGRRKIPLRRLCDVCYQVTYDKKYYTNNELLDCGKNKVVCLLFPWVVRPQQNIMFINSTMIKSLPNTQLSKIKLKQVK